MSKGRCLSINRLNTKMLRVHSFILFTIETPRALIALTSFYILIVEKLQNVLYNKHY